MSSLYIGCLIGSDCLRPQQQGGGARDWPSHPASGAQRPSCPRSQGHLRPRNHAVLRATLTWSWPGATLALGQWNGERDTDLLTDAPGDVPVAGHVFGHQHVTGDEPSLGTVSRLKF